MCGINSCIHDKVKIILMKFFVGKLTLIIMILVATACGSEGSVYEAEARERAVVMAKEVLKMSNRSTFEVERVILEAKVAQSEYLLKGDTVAAKAFDESFRAYVQTNDSIFAKELF